MRIGPLTPLLAALALLAAPSTSAQTTLGPGSPGSGGFVPELCCPQAWLGNGAFHIALEKGRGGAVAVLALSLAPAQTTAFGAPIWIEGTQVFFNQTFSLSGVPGAPGDGGFVLPVPLTFAAPPSLADARFYAQAGVVDFVGGVPAVSNGLEIQLTLPPEVFVGTSVGGGSDPFWRVDPIAQTVVQSGATTFTDNVDGAVYADGGKSLYATSSIRRQISHADLTSGTPVWSIFHTFLSGTANGLQYDAARRILWAIGDSGSGLQLAAFDADQQSPTYGTLMGETTQLGQVGILGRWALSPSGDFAVVPQVLGSAAFLFDTDPLSPTWLQLQSVLPIPTSSASSLWINSRVLVSEDEDQILIVRQGTGATPAELARYSFSFGSFIDHDLATLPIDNLGQFSSPAVPFGAAPTGLSRPGPCAPDFVIVGGFGDDGTGTGSQGWVGRLDLDPFNPFAWSWTPGTGVALPNAWASGVDQDGTRVAVTTWAPPMLHLLDAATMAHQATIPLLGSAPNIYTVLWR